MADHPLKSLSLHEKLSYFYCAYAREEAIDPEVDVHAVRLWEKIKVSRRKCRERVAFLLQHVENVSQSQVRHLDSTYRAKRELLLLAEGTIGPTASSGRTDNALAQAESARINNELLQDCGALSVFSEHLQRSIHAFRTLNFQHLDMDQVDTMIRELQQDMVLMFMLILFNANRQNASFDRQLLFLGTSAPSYTLVAIIDCLIQMNVLPGFPIKRLLMLFHEWFAAILGDTVALDKLKLLRSFKEFTDSHSMALDPQDAYYLQKRRFAKIRQEIHDNFKRRQSSPNTTRCDLRIPCRLLISIISLQLLLAWPIKQPGFFKRDSTRSLLPRGCGIWRALMWKQHIRGILGNGIDSHHLSGWRRRFFTLWRIVGMVENVSYFGDDFGQKIDLTVRIREILRNYPAKWLISGPALLVYNNATFSETDFESIQRIGDSLKKDNSHGWKTGRFGIGFNSGKWLFRTVI
ncbi:hypothetical protein ATCC90586_008899 [Pythium insidiosum]|nr:hypothetical protein ATCC90586_008899 [Pythium insidiosum]